MYVLSFAQSAFSCGIFVFFAFQPHVCFMIVSVEKVSGKVGWLYVCPEGVRWEGGDFSDFIAFIRAIERVWTHLKKPFVRTEYI